MNPSQTTALVLCGGLGTRLRPLTYHTPKPLAKVNGVPAIDYILNYLGSYGVKKIFMDVHYLAEKIIKHVGGRAIFSYNFHLMGTAGAILPVLPYMSDPFFVLNGDTITNLDLSEMWSAHKPKKAMTIFTKDNAIHNGGVFLVSKRLAVAFLVGQSLHEQVIPNLDQNSISLFGGGDCYYFDIGTPDKLAKARRFFADKN